MSAHEAPLRRVPRHPVVPLRHQLLIIQRAWPAPRPCPGCCWGYRGGHEVTTEGKSDTVALWVNGELLAEFIVDKLAVQITRHEVLIRGECRDTYADKVLLNSDVLEALGYAPDGSDVPNPPSRWRRFMQALGLIEDQP